MSKPPVDAGPDTSICISNPVIQLQVNGQAPFLWNNGGFLNDATSATPTATLPDTGNYTFVVTADAGGLCERNDTMVLTVDPNVFATASLFPDTICSGGLVQLDATVTAGNGNYLYQWTSNPPGFSSTANSTTDNPTVSTDYIISVTSGACKSFDTVSVVARVLPSSDFTVNPTVLCAGQVASVVYTGIAAPDYSFDWNFANGNVMSGTGSGPYNVSWATAGQITVTLSVTDQHGCTSTNAVTLTVNVTPDVSFESITGGCEPLTVDFTNTSTGGVSYQWSFGDGTTSTEENPSHTYSAGLYDVSLTVTSSENCTAGITLPGYIEVLTVPVADASVTEDITHPWDLSQATFHFQNSSQNATAYNWDFGDGTSSSEVNPTHTYLSLDTFYVLLTASNKYCDDTIRLGPIIIVFYDELFFPSAFSPNNDGANDQFHELQQVGISNLYYSVYNRWGQLVYETNAIDGRWDGSFKGKPADVGVYVWYAKADMVNGSHISQKGNVTLVR